MSTTTDLVKKPNLKFWRDLYNEMQVVYEGYQEETKRCIEGLRRDYAAQVRYYLTQTALYNVAVANGYQAADISNKVDSARHTEVLIGELLITTQFSRRPYELGIDAEYRRSYASMEQEDFFPGSESLGAFASEYLLVVHGYSQFDKGELGFLQAGQPHPLLKKFIEAPINIVSLLSDIEAVPAEPDFITKPALGLKLS